MALLNHDDNIKEYWQQVKDKYPDVDFNRFKQVCKAPFNYFKECIRNDNFPMVLIKYLGKLRPFPGRIGHMINILSRKPEPHYVEKTAFLRKYLKQLNDFDRKDQDALSRRAETD